MAIDLKYKYPKETDKINENITQISEQSISKDVANIDTAGINKTVSAAYDQTEIEAIRVALL
ncbi:MAG TPA: hypothetical protein PL089_15020, partial [Ignavibacteria bacterium]|nr:hypothetical protein [Ignavibacteria bacterium]